MFYFSTKSETLDCLRPLLKTSSIPASYSFAALDWTQRKSAILEDIAVAFPQQCLIFRSSAANEDAQCGSMAGVFESVAFVFSTDEKAMVEAIERVLASYICQNGSLTVGDLVLVQVMVDNISMSGVVLTQDLRSGAPYYVINYDEISGRHDGVTSGSDLTRTLLIHHGYERRLRSTRFMRLLEAVQEIADVVGTSGLDIEFIVDTSEKVYILQVRPMAVRRNWNRSMVRKVDLALDQTREFVREAFRPALGLCGKKALFGLMPDWNPVEMLGAAPRPLAVSLYRMLITDSVWAQARATMGYKDVSDQALLVELSGRPYIDVRKSFNSFLPAELPADIGENLVNIWLAHLEGQPELHDKIEFEVAITTHTPFFEHVYKERFDTWGVGLADQGKITSAFKNITVKILCFKCLRNTLQKTKFLDSFGSVSGHRGFEALRHAAHLLHKSRKYGTLPFSILARLAFIAESILRALIFGGALSQERAQAFRASIRTVLTDFLEDMRFLGTGALDQGTFLARYGHLRPGSYDILSPRYDQRQGVFNGVRNAQEPLYPPKIFALTQSEKNQIDAALSQEGYPVNAEVLFAWMADAISGRELAKFRFTRVTSLALEQIAMWGEDIGLSREELSYIRIEDIIRTLTTTPLAPLEDMFRLKARENMEAHSISQAVHLPYLLCTLDDVDIVPLHKSRPNFVTTKKICTKCIVISGHESVPDLNLKGLIVFIESADPGFDWIFAHGIGGLVTKYGGANSHMAIRCAELGIPAAIGCGEQLFEHCKKQDEVILDCGAELLLAQRRGIW